MEAQQAQRAQIEAKIKIKLLPKEPKVEEAPKQEKRVIKLKPLTDAEKQEILNQAKKAEPKIVKDLSKGKFDKVEFLK